MNNIFIIQTVQINRRQNIFSFNLETMPSVIQYRGITVFNFRCKVKYCLCHINSIKVNCQLCIKS